VYFESFAAFWHMAGHGSFVWSAYGMSFVVLGLLVLQPLVRYRRELGRIKNSAVAVLQQNATPSSADSAQVEK
jgi:heme exporter protein D